MFTCDSDILTLELNRRSEWVIPRMVGRGKNSLTDNTCTLSAHATDGTEST